MAYIGKESKKKKEWIYVYGISSSHVWMLELDHKEGWPRIDTFKLWYWRRLLRVPWTARRSNQSILKEINSEYSLEGLMLTLKLQFFGHLMWRPDSLEKTLMLGKRKRNKMVGWHHVLNGHEFEQTPGDGEGQKAWHAAVYGVTKSWIQLSNWTTT